MKVTVSVRGKFHAFDLARELHARGHLERLITTYPPFALRPYAVPRNRVASLVYQEAASRLWERLPSRLRPLDPGPLFAEAFDRAAAHHVPAGTDLYVGWSSFSERGLERARTLGAVTVLERGSAHIETQRDLLLEEYALWGGAPALPAPAIVAKECREYEAAQYISVPSSFARRSFVDRGFAEDRVLTLPYGADVTRFQPADRLPDTFRLIYAGGMTLRKGFQYLLKAFTELRLPGAELWLIGAASPDSDALFPRYEGSFRHVGSVPQAELSGLFRQCSAFALCSIEDGFGMVVLQAMASGLPVICTTNTGGPDAIGDGVEGFVIPIRDVDALKERIVFLYEHRDACRAMGERARRRVERGFTWQDYGARVSEAYLHAIDSRREVVPA